MRDDSHFLKFHHCRRPLDGVHYTKRFVDLLLIQAFIFFSAQQQLLQLFQQLHIFKHKHLHQVICIGHAQLTSLLISFQVKSSRTTGTSAEQRR